MIEPSIAKTGRLIVVSEDTQTSGSGQAIIATQNSSQSDSNGFSGALLRLRVRRSTSPLIQPSNMQHYPV